MNETKRLSEKYEEEEQEIPESKMRKKKGKM